MIKKTSDRYKFFIVIFGNLINVILLFRVSAAHVDNEVYLGRALERLGDAALKEQEPDIGAAFLKFAVVTKELSALMKTLVRIGFFLSLI